MHNAALLRMVATTLEDGGGTFSPAGYALSFEAGYAVSLRGGSAFTWDRRHQPLSYLVGKFEEALENRPDGTYIGTWVDDLTVYIDRTVVVYNRALALEMAKENGQVAIYDFAKNESIRIEANEPIEADEPVKTTMFAHDEA